RRSSVARTDLVLDGHHRTVSVDLDGICATGEVEPLRPQRDGTQHPAPAFLATLPAVDPTMPALPADRVRVVLPHAVDVDERALPRTVRVVLDGGQRERWRGFHHGTRSDANARVASDDALGT